MPEPARSSALAPDDRRRVVYAIAYAALVPVLLMAVALWWAGDAATALASALMGYLAVVTGFLGGVHWGVALRYIATNAQTPVFHFVWGPIPAYLAWGASLCNAWLGLLLLAMVSALAYLVDLRTWPGAGLAPWLRLRGQFTAGLMGCCLLAASALTFRPFA